MESDLRGNSFILKREIVCKARPGKILSLFMWYLGLIEWSHPVVDSLNEVCLDRLLIIDRPTWQRKVLFLSSLTSLLFILLGSLFTTTWYCVCYFGSLDHLLRFTSFTFFYWPILMSAQVVCITAAVKNFFKQHGSEITYTFANVFNEQSFASKWYARSSHFGKATRFCKVLACFCLLIGVNSFFELEYFFSLDIECRPWPKYIVLVFRIWGLVFYSTFCYFLYLQRSFIEEQIQHTAWYVREHCPNLEACIQKIGRLFNDYYQLRQLLLPWLNFVLFSTTFGLAAFFSWKYHEAQDTIHNETANATGGSFDAHQIEWGFKMKINISELCRLNCEYNNSTDNRTVNHNIFDILVFSEKLMVVTFAIFVVGGIDLKYKWDRFKLKINMTYTSKNAECWKHLDKFVRHLHPDTLNDTIKAYIIPLVGLALGFISNLQFGV